MVCISVSLVIWSLSLVQRLLAKGRCVLYMWGGGATVSPRGMWIRGPLLGISTVSARDLCVRDTGALELPRTARES